MGLTRHLNLGPMTVGEALDSTRDRHVKFCYQCRFASHARTPKMDPRNPEVIKQLAAPLAKSLLENGLVTVTMHVNDELMTDDFTGEIIVVAPEDYDPWHSKEFEGRVADALRNRESLCENVVRYKIRDYEAVRDHGNSTLDETAGAVKILNLLQGLLREMK